jgi:FdhD protein
MAARRRCDTMLVTRVETTGDGQVLRRRPDDLIVEEPLTIHLDGHLVATTMRTPGHDYELAVGYCFTEGLLGGHSVDEVRYCATGSAVDTGFNVVSVSTQGRAPVPTPRLGVTSSSCGLCGTEHIDTLANRLMPLNAQDAAPLRLDLLRGIPDQVLGEQGLFSATGAVHAAAAVTAEGQVLCVREDVGRHNALDKVIGRLALDGSLPATGLVAFVSGRASFELVAKAWAAGFAALVAVSAPTALAVQTARRAGLVLVGFMRSDSMNLYSPERWNDPR